MLIPKKKHKLMIISGFLIFFVLSPFFSQFFYSMGESRPIGLDNDPINLRSSSIYLIESSLSIPYGTNVQEDRNYDFSGVFYDSSNKLRTWNDDCFLETIFVLDPDVSSNATITELDNTEVISPENTSITMISGIFNQSGTLNALDGDPAIFNSSYEEVIAGDLNVINGIENNVGELGSIDGNYSQYSSYYESDAPTYQEGSVIQGFNASGSYDLYEIDGSYATFNSTEASGGSYYYGVFDFEDVSIGSLPSNFTDISGAGCTAGVVQTAGNHSKVLELFDNSGGVAEAKTYFDFTSGQTTGTVEYWIFQNDTTSVYSNVSLSNEVGTNVIEIGMYTDAFIINLADFVCVASANQWYHVRIDFDCSTDDFEFFVNQTSYGTFSMQSSSTTLNRMSMGSYSAFTGYFFYIDAIGLSWNDEYEIGDNLGFGGGNAEFEIIFMSYLNIELQDLCLHYSLKTDISQAINVYVYNFDFLQWDLINNSISLTFTHDLHILNSSYYNSSAYMNFKINGSGGNTFHLFLEMLSIRNMPSLELEAIINCNLLDNLIYSYKTNISQFIEIYLYNFDTSTYVLVGNASYLSFNLLSASVLSTYHNTTSIKVKFMALNQTSQDFSFYLEVLKVASNHEIEFTLYVELDEFFDYLTQINCTAWYYTSIYQTVNFSIYDFEDETWVLINSSVNLDYYPSIFVNDTNFMFDLINQDDNDKILFKIVAENQTNEFDLFLDKLEVKTFRKLLLSSEKSFTLLGTWKYRFHIPEDSYSSSWYYFDVVLSEDNVELISESSYITSWEFIGGYDTTNLYESDFSMDSWSLYDVAQENMIINDLGKRSSYIGGSSEDFTYNANYSTLEKLGTSQLVGICWNGSHFYVTTAYTWGVSVFDTSFNCIQNLTYPSSWTDYYGYGIEWYDNSLYIIFPTVEDPFVAVFDDITFTNTHNYTLSGTIQPFGICHSNNNFYVIDGIGTFLIYDNTFNLQDNITLVSYGSMILMDITSDGNYFYITNGESVMSPKSNMVMEYDSSFVNTRNITLVDNSSRFGVCYDGSNYFFANLEKFSVEKYLGSSPIIPKFNKLSDRVYMQTNITELISMQTDFTSLSLQSGDKITVTFNTSSSNEIDFLLLNSNTTIKEFIISEQGNVNFNTRSITVNIDSSYIINTMRFSSIFDDTNNLIITDIVIFRYNTVVITHELNPQGIKTIYLDYPINYSYYVYEKNILKDSGYVYTSESLQTLTYEKIEQQVVYITFHDSNNEYLEFQNYRTYANFTLDGIEYEETILTNDILYVDVETEIDFMVYDSFNVLIKTATKNAYTHIDLILPVFSLKIKNEASKNVNYSLSKESVQKTGYLFPQEIVEFSISSGDYSLIYTNQENGIQETYNFTLNGNKLISINTTYYEVYFSLFSFDGLGIDHDLVRFYIDNDRKDLGFNTITQRYIDVLVLDFFNHSLFNQTIDTQNLLEFNIFVEIYTLNVVNLFSFDDIMVNITQEGSGIWMHQLIPIEMSMPYRFLPNINYTITVEYLNGTLYREKEINLTSNGQIESFGVTSEYPGVEEFPKDVYIGIYSSTGLGIDFDMVKLYINIERTDFGFNTFETTSNNITVLDYFDTILFSQIVNVSGIYEYSIEITLYSFKIKNEATKYANFTLQFGDHITDNFILPEEIIEYQLSPNYYLFNYTNTENNYTYFYNISLQEDRIFIIESTYREIYFSLYTYDGFGIDHDLIRFYINGSRRDLGFNTIESEFCLLLVLDYFDNILFLQVINCYDLIIPEYSIYLEIYTLSVLNLYKDQDIRIEITVEGSDIVYSQVISSQNNIPFRLVPDLEYTITAFDINETELESKKVDLEDNNMIVDFGFYQEEVYPDPLPILNSFQVLIFFCFFVLGIFAIIVVLYVYWKKEQSNVPEQLKPYMKKQKKKSQNTLNTREIYE